MQTKVCTKCGLEKEATSEYFIRCKSNKDGLRCSCKQCMREYDNNRKEQKVEYNKTYRKDNIEHLNAFNKKYREENYGKEQLRHKKYRIDNHEKLLIKERQFYLQNKDSENERFRVYYEKNKTKINTNIKEYRIANPNVDIMICARRRTRKLALSATLTINQWEIIKNEFNNCCAYCGKEKPLAQEHFLALSKGGEYTINNIIPSCKNCNSSKSNRDFKKWYKNYKHYNKKRESKILKYLHYNNGIQQLMLEI